MRCPKNISSISTLNYVILYDIDIAFTHIVSYNIIVYKPIAFISLPHHHIIKHVYVCIIVYIIIWCHFILDVSSGHLT